MSSLAARDDPLYDAVAARLRQPEASAGSPVVLLVLTGALFVATQRGAMSVSRLAVLVGVLLFHELGHWVGMRWFGYRDVRMFFIPFLGAAVAGRSVEVAPWKRGIVLLLGPLPGLALAGLAVLAGASTSPVGRPVIVMLVVINAFNLLPLEPLDGGRLMNLVLFSRSRWIETLTLLSSGIGLGYLGMRFDDHVLTFVGILVAIAARVRFRLAGVTADLRRRGETLPLSLADASDGQLRGLYAAVRPLAGWTARVQSVVALVRQLHERVLAGQPSLRQSLLLLLLYATGFGFAAVVPWEAFRGPTTPWGWTPGDRAPLNGSAMLTDHSLVVHFPSSFVPHVSDRVIVLIRRLPEHGQELAVFSDLSNVTSEKDLADRNGAMSRLVPGARATAYHRAACNGQRGFHVDWTSDNDSGWEGQSCTFTRGSHDYLVAYAVPRRVAVAEGPVLQAIIEAADFD